MPTKCNFYNNYLQNNKKYPEYANFRPVASGHIEGPKKALFRPYCAFF